MYLTPRVVEVRAIENYCLYIRFEDGKKKVYDMKPLIENNKFYEKLKNKDYFKMVRIRGITVEWQNGEDVCPENLYNDSTDYCSVNDN